MNVTVFPTIGEVPGDLFGYLTDQLTYWKKNWAMRPTAERYRAAEPGQHPVAVAFEDGKAIGWVMCEYAHVVQGCVYSRLQMFVHEQHRRKGVATAIVRELREQFRQRWPNASGMALFGYDVGNEVVTKAETHG